GLYAAVVVWSLVRLLGEAGDPRRRPWSALLVATAALTRPDGLGVLAVAAACRLVAGGDRRRVAAWFALAIGPVAAHELWRFWYYAYPLPNTFYAKMRAPFRLRELRDFDGAGWLYVRRLAEAYRLKPLTWLAALALVVPGPLPSLLKRWWTAAVLVAL